MNSDLTPSPTGLDDPSEQSLWRPLRLLQSALDDDIARLYAEAQIDGLKPSYVLELLRLHARGPMTITELAESVQRTHSGTSQKVAAMRAAGLVRTVAGPDARSKRVVLTARARRHRRPAGRGVAGDGGHAGRDRGGDPLPAQPGRRGHRAGVAAQELPRPDRREAGRRRRLVVRRALIDLARCVGSRPFRRLWIGQGLPGLGGQMTLVAVMFQVWQIHQAARCGPAPWGWPRPSR